MATGSFLGEEKLDMAKRIAKRIQTGMGELNDCLDQLQDIKDSITEERGKMEIDRLIRRIIDNGDD